MIKTLRRLFDIVAAGIGLLVLMPFAVPLFIALRLSGEGEIFYSQTRLGFGNKPFEILKLATMLKNSQAMKGGKITLRNDPRLTPLGGFLRKSKLNELPQLWNVFVGDMTIIGPRPLPPESHDWYRPHVRKVVALSVPGLSGIASLVFRDEEAYVSASDRDPVEFYRDVIFPYKGDLELWYYDHKSIATDVKILWFTVMSIINPNRVTIFQEFNDLPSRPIELR